MGKCKKRNLYRSSNSSSNISSNISFMTRETAVNNVFRMITESSNNHFKKERSIFRKALDTISLFGISAEELSEAGVPYENLKALGSAIN